MSNSIKVQTCFVILGENLDTELITEKLKFSPSSVLLQTDPLRTILADSGPRTFDPRWNLDCWKNFLTSKQLRLPLDKQLEFWVGKLYPVRSAFQEFQKLGYWSVIDCNRHTDDPELLCIQFRLTNKLVRKLSQISIDVDFAIDIQQQINNPKMYMFTDDGNEVSYYDMDGKKLPGPPDCL
ncbi:MAG: DUF4279 domain-containing protein [Okeania sp. SIO3C4]|nr:DUF4279 domain-containing protein [Okeania sp. SIO3C4]